MDDQTVRDLLSRQPNPTEKVLDGHRDALHLLPWRISVKEHTDHFLKTGKRVVALECGHYTMTNALKRAACPRCGEMIRNGFDHDGFRRHGLPDTFSWPDDPLRLLHERDEFGDTITRQSLG